MKNPHRSRNFRDVAQISDILFMNFTENRMNCLHFLRMCAIIKLNSKGMRGTLTRSFRTLSKESRPQPDGFSFCTDPFYYNINELKKQVENSIPALPAVRTEPESFAFSLDSPAQLCYNHGIR